MKRLSIVIIILCLSLSVVGCSNGYQNSNKQPIQTDSTANKQEETEFTKAMNDCIKIFSNTGKPLSDEELYSIADFCQKYENKQEFKDKFIPEIQRIGEEALNTSDRTYVERVTKAVGMVRFGRDELVKINDNLERKVIEIGGSIATANVGQQNNANTINTQQQNNKLTSEDGNLTLQDYSSGGGYVIGTILNNSKYVYSYVEVDINLYDKNGNLLSSTISNVENLDAFKNWKFKAPVVDEKNVAKFQVMKIVGRK
ncbi:FxLYD domain-containing protein [Clostridium manihotivorum]|uniref:Lipoprotein n=1 Tax=Clostridium manihotivorum TaxID=2320868 RepID=A0A3R5U7T5_9CLOT|nr:FxLYD domain-containing protein [Clostridium manihotivorum]QAA34094.1 hypothetical protein C1I91_22060 [Clostridium manihotivorum]